MAANPQASCVFGGVEQFISPELTEAERARIVCPPGARQARLAGALLVTRAAFERIGYFNVGLGIGETIDWVARGDEVFR